MTAGSETLFLAAESASRPQRTWVADLKTGETATIQLACCHKETRPTKSGKPYLCLTLRDRTGEAEGRIWDNAEEHGMCFSVGDVVKVFGSVDAWNGQKQISIQKIRRCELEEYSLGDFMEASERDPQEMLDELMVWIEGVRDQELQQLIAAAVLSGRPALSRAPAAQRMHHAYPAGLLEHIVSMVAAASRMCGHYPRLDRDLLIAGCVMHDIGKLDELQSDLIGTVQYTTPGNLIGHIAMAYGIVERTWRPEWNQRRKLELQHLILSHHGEYQFGSPRLPAMAEAIALHYIDNLDAKLNQFWRAVDRAADGQEWTERVSGLGRELYRGEQR